MIIDWPRNDSEANMKNRNRDNTGSDVALNRSASMFDAGQKPSAALSAKNAQAPTAVAQRSATQKPRRVRPPRDLSDGLPPYSTVREFAAIAHVHPRTISRDIDDGLLIATNFRGARRISRKDGRAYLRKIRGNVGHSHRRRSPRKSIKNTKTLNEEECP